MSENKISLAPPDSYFEKKKKKKKLLFCKKKKKKKIEKNRSLHKITDFFFFFFFFCTKIKISRSLLIFKNKIRKPRYQFGVDLHCFIIINIVNFRMLQKLGVITIISLILLFEPRHDKTCLREFPTRPDTQRPAQPQPLARVLKFRL